MNWIDKEDGPDCLCGMPTCVTIIKDNFYLMCLFHTSEAGAIFPLPKNNKPENWPNLSEEEMIKLIDQGFVDQNEEN